MNYASKYRAKTEINSKEKMKETEAHTWLRNADVHDQLSRAAKQ